MTETIKPYAAPVIHREYTVVTFAAEEYFVRKVNPKNLKVMRVKDGRLQMGPKRIFTYVRDMTAEDHKTMADHRAFSKEAVPEVDTRTFGLGNHVVLKEGIKPVGNVEPGTVYVVIGVNAKTINIVPDGGHGNGSEYFQYPPATLEIVKANNRQRTAN